MSTTRSHARTALLAALLSLAAVLPARAGTSYLLHLKISDGHRGKGVDVAMPWDVSKGSSPFDFVSDTHDRPEIERLRAAWSMLSRMPEGRTVIIHSEKGRTRAWRRDGQLVLEPLDDGEHSGTRIRIPAPVVEAVLRRDGRLRTDDLAAILRERGEIGLVDVDSDDARVRVWIDRDED
ncbi:MAG: hypothetical protein HZA61_04180 [Candidatus Eisenbacteria bacterium]|uniref:Uncharacterized protein n=1 Tax=Eiseniibacteriota bacterium TaxID=2212470 RepID=A0A933SDX5_UNCEI|nr:hypothetical protein [Candidatus Eisenbacteria bacterium]